MQCKSTKTMFFRFLSTISTCSHVLTNSTKNTIQLNKGKTKFDGYASPKIASRNLYVLRGVSIPCNNESSLVLRRARYTDDNSFGYRVCPNYGAKELSTTNIAWGRSNYSVVVRMVIISSLSSASEHVPLLLELDKGQKSIHTCVAKLYT